MKLAFVLIFLALSCSSYGRYTRQGFRKTFEDFGKSISKRIVDGSQVPIEKAPFMALVFADVSYIATYPHASAVIISDLYLLSSASFFYQHRNKSMVAYLGESDLTSFVGKNKYFVSNVTFHEQFHESHINNYNIALIKVEGQIEFNNYQKPIALLSPNDVVNYGYGFDEPKKRIESNDNQRSISLSHNLLFTKVDIFGFGFTERDGNDRTIVLMTKKVYYPIENLQTSLIEVENVKTCAGDAGAPLIMGDKLVAINIDAKNRCGETSSTKLLVTGVAAYYEWILRKIGEDALSCAEKNAFHRNNTVHEERHDMSYLLSVM